jgi:hypothetical protein
MTTVIDSGEQTRPGVPEASVATVPADPPPTRGSSAAGRRCLIREAIEERRRARAEALSRGFGVSEMTIRRDFVVLEDEGSVVRAHSGAFAPSSATTVRAPGELGIVRTLSAARLAHRGEQ